MDRPAGSATVRGVELGLIVPQGWTGEYAGWQPRAAWERTLAIARTAEGLGIGSLWVFDHFMTVPEPREELTFESFTVLAGLAASTERPELGHVVMCGAFRNPALVAKMMGTLDVISGGRMITGIGAGWKQDEWLAYGYGFPDTATRLHMLRDQLEVITRLLEPGPATYAGEHASVGGAINVPRGIRRPRIPVMVGGNGPNITWRLAARYADELNLDWLDPDEVRAALPTIHARCEEIGREPTTLRLSVNINRDVIRHAGQRRIELFSGYVEVGVERVMGLLLESVQDDEALPSLVEDARAAGLRLSV